MLKYKNVDKLRGVACLLVLLYHIYAITGKLLIDIPIIEHLHIMGGDIGVTIFFVLSGYGIFFSLEKMNSEGGISFVIFMKKRITRICPQYYLNMIVLLLLSSSVVYLSKEHIWKIFIHIVFLHSLTMESHGAINGVLWTMSVIFQFYILAIPLYTLIKKIDNIIISGFIFVGFTVLAKYLVLNYLWVESIEQFGSFAIMIPGRQLLTALDNFGIGMLVASYTIKQRDSKFIVYKLLALLVGVVGICTLAVMACSHPIYERNIWGYTFFSILSIAVGFFIYGISFEVKDGLISRALLLVAKHEYTIYLWHLPIIINLVGNSDMVINCMGNDYRICLYTIIMAICLAFGMVMDNI